MTMTPVGHEWSLTFFACLLIPIFVHATPINRQVGISENVFITVQNDTYGIEQRVCSIDSMTYGDGETIPTSSPCEHCICRPPGFACTIISCEYRPGCKSFKRSNQCCPEYQCECEKDGKIYQNGEKIMDSNNPCEICYCQGGEIICAVIDCYWRSDCQPRYIENRCCPLYDHCPPPNSQGPYGRPTIATTTTSSGFPWFNLSSAVYETSSATPVPVFITSSAPTTTPPQSPAQPDLVVVATEEPSILTNILATAQEESENKILAKPEESNVVENTEGLSIPIQENVEEAVPLEPSVAQVLPIQPEVESAPVNVVHTVSAEIPVIPELNDKLPADLLEPETIPVVITNASENETIPEIPSPAENETLPVIITNSSVDETIPVVITNSAVNETIPVENQEENETVLEPIVSENNETVVAPTNPVNIEEVHAPLSQPINETIPSDDAVTESVPLNTDVNINEIVPGNQNESEAVAEDEKVQEVAPIAPEVNEESILPVNDEIQTTPTPDIQEIVQNAPVAPEEHDSVVISADESESDQHQLSPEISESVQDPSQTVHMASDSVSVSADDKEVNAIPQSDDVKATVPTVLEINETNQIQNVSAPEEVTEGVPANDDVVENSPTSPEIVPQHTVPVTSEDVEIPQADEEVTTTAPVNVQIPIQVQQAILEMDAANEKLAVVQPVAVHDPIVETEENVPTSSPVIESEPSVQESALNLQTAVHTEPLSPSSSLEIAPTEGEIEPTKVADLSPEPSPVSIQLSSSPSPVDQSEPLASIIPSPVDPVSVIEETMSSQPAPEVFAQVMDEDKEAISQSENAVQVDEEVVRPTESLPAMISSLQTETVSATNSAATQEITATSQDVIAPTDPIEANEVISPNTVIPEAHLDQTIMVNDNVEVPTTTGPQIEDVAPSVSFDEVQPIVEEVVEVTTVGKVEDSPVIVTDSPMVLIVEPIPSIATILMPPNKDKEQIVEAEVATEGPVQVSEQKPVEDIVAPSTDLVPPTQDFVGGSINQDEVEFQTTVSAVLENVNESENTVADSNQEDEEETRPTTVSSILQNDEEKVSANSEIKPVIPATYLPVPQQAEQEQDEPSVADEVTTQEPSKIVAIYSDYNPPHPVAPEQVENSEFLEDSPVHIQGSDSSEMAQSPVNEQIESLEVAVENVKPLDDAPMESVTTNETPVASDEPKVPEQEVVQTTVVPVVVESFDAVPVEESTPIEAEKQQETEGSNDEPEIATSTSSPEVPENITTPQDSPIKFVSMEAEKVQADDTAEKVPASDNIFEIIPPGSENIPSPPEIQNQVRDKEPETEVQAQQDDSANIVQDTDKKPTVEVLEEVKPETVQNENVNVSNDDTVVILAEQDATLSSVDKKADNEVNLGPILSSYDDDTVEIVAADAPSDQKEEEVTTSAPAVVQPQMDETKDKDDSVNIVEVAEKKPTVEVLDEVMKPEESSEDEAEEIHPDDQHEDDQDQVVLQTTQAFQNDENAIIPTTSSPILSSDDHEEEKLISQDENEQENEIITTTSPVEHDDDSEEEAEITQDEPDNNEQEDEAVVPTTGSSLVQNDENDSEAQTTPQPAEVMNKVQKVAEKLKSEEELEASPSDSSSESKFRLDLSAFWDSDDSNEVQSTSSPVGKVASGSGDIVFDEVAPTHLPPIESLTLDQTTVKEVKLSRDDMENVVEGTTTGRNNLRDDVEVTTHNLRRDIHSDSEENLINDELTTSVPSLRQENAQELTTLRIPLESENEVVLRADPSTNDFIELPTGSPLGFAAEYHDDGITTTKPEFRGETATGATEANDDSENEIVATAEPIVFDEEAVSTTETEVNRAKSDQDATTFANDETVDVTTAIPAPKRRGGIDHMVIPEKGFPQPDPVAHEMIPKKEDKLARLDLNDNDSWLYQTFNKIRQLSGLFPASNQRVRKLTRQPRDVGQEGQEEANPPKSKTYFKKTKKATGDGGKKSPRRKSFLPSRSFVFF